VVGTFLFYALKGIVTSKAQWKYTVLATFIIFVVLFFSTYPEQQRKNITTDKGIP